MSLHDALKNLKFDNRMTEINLRNGQLTQEEMKKHLASLPDSADQAASLNLEDDKKDMDLGARGAAH